MPKFCQICGNLVDDSAAVCDACGSPMNNMYPEEPVTLNAQTQYTQQPYQQQYTQQPYQQQYAQPPYQQQYAQPQYQQQYAQPQYPQQYPSNPMPQPKKKSKKGLIIGISVGAVVLAAAAAAFFIWILPMLSGQSTPQDCIDKIIDEVGEGDIDGALDYVYETKCSSTYKAMVKQQLSSQSGFNEAMLMMKGMGKDGIRKMIEIKATDEKEVSSSEKDTIIQTLKQGGVPTDGIEKIVAVNLHVINKMQNETQDTPCYFIKVKGKYYILASALAMFGNSSSSIL